MLRFFFGVQTFSWVSCSSESRFKDSKLDVEHILQFHGRWSEFLEGLGQRGETLSLGFGVGQGVEWDKGGVGQGVKWEKGWIGTKGWSGTRGGVGQGV